MNLQQLKYIKCVIKENDIPSRSNDELQSKLIVIYYHNQGTYDNQQPIQCIFLQNHEGTEYAVLKEKERNASPFVDEKLISWNVWTEKNIVYIVVLIDPDTNILLSHNIIIMKKKIGLK